MESPKGSIYSKRNHKKATRQELDEVNQRLMDI